MLTVYSKKHCPFCDQAKALLNRKNIAFEEVRIDEDATAKEFILREGHRTVPQIYKGTQLFVEGGYQGLAKLSDQDLQERLGAVHG